MQNSIINLVSTNPVTPSRDPELKIRQNAAEPAQIEPSNASSAVAKSNEDAEKAAEKPIELSVIKDMVSQVNQLNQTIQRDIRYNVDEESGLTVISVVESETGKLVRQIPSEDVMAVVSHLMKIIESNAEGQTEIPQGLIFSGKT